jgi:DNA-binding transcriptional ArsR family regulator
VDDASVGAVLDTIGDERAREVLARIHDEPRSAKALASACDLSLPTVYRRIEMLEECDFVTHHTLVAEDGNHYNVYESNFRRTVVTLDDGGYRVRVHREGSGVDGRDREPDDPDPNAVPEKPDREPGPCDPRPDADSGTE